MRLTDLNPEGGIGANSLLLELGAFRLLIDAGLNPKKSGPEATPRLDLLRDLELDLVVLTHCHLDHLGSLPLVLRAQPRVTVLMSIPSLHLAERMLHNSVNVMLREREEKQVAGYPLFSHDEVSRGAVRFFGQTFGQTRRLSKNGQTLEVTLYPAGHVAGAAGVLLVHDGRRIFLTGDCLFTAQETLDGARFPAVPVDTLVMETTRGSTPRPVGQTRETEVDRFLATLAEVVAGGGSVLVPVFALGRLQEVMTLLLQGRKDGRLPEAPVFSGGLGLDLADYFDEITRKTGQLRFTKQVLKELGVQPAPRDSVPGRSPGRRGIYVLSSGMLVEHTPSYRLAASLLGKPEHAVCFVGYCDPDAPGGRLLQTAPGDRFTFEALEWETVLRARVLRFELTGHADRDELVDFALARKPRTVVLTHGEAPARAWFRETLEARQPGLRVVDPVPLQSGRI